MYDSQADSYLAIRPWLNCYFRQRTAFLVSPWLRNFKKEQVILHLGCGVGWLEESVSRSSADLSYVGVDFSPKMARSIKKRFPWIQMVIADVDALPFRSSCVDGIIVNRVIKYVSARRVFSQANKIVKDNGSIIVIFDRSDILIERFLRGIHRSYETAYRTSDILHLLAEQNFLIVAFASLINLPLFVYYYLPKSCCPLLSFVDKIVETGRITVIFGLKDQKK
jgi:ubiquinone/menaquinone biosynthesis C-methylase UbiE